MTASTFLELTAQLRSRFSRKLQDNGQRYDWPAKQQGYVLSSFFLGFVLMHIPGGQCAERFGAKPVLMVGLLASAVFILLIPIAVPYTGVYGLIVLRFLTGLTQGGVFPSMNATIAAWAPAKERGRFTSLIFCGIPVEFRFLSN